MEALTTATNQIKVKDLINKESFYEEIAKAIEGIYANTNFKGGLDPLAIDDILEMIKYKYKHLTIEDIKTAFKLNRWGETKEVELYNSFNASYVSKVLDLYLEWKRKKNAENKPKATETQQLEQGERDKRSDDISFACSMYRGFLERGEVPIGGYWMAFDTLVEIGVFPTFEQNKEEYTEFIENAKTEWASSLGSKWLFAEDFKRLSIKKEIQECRLDNNFRMYKKKYMDHMFSKYKEKGFTIDDFRNGIEKAYDRQNTKNEKPLEIKQKDFNKPRVRAVSF